MSTERLMNVLLSPHISEKATNISAVRQYAFKVVGWANKHDIKKAVEMLFNVKVSNVCITNKKPTSKRFGRNMGQSKGWKKAYVSLEEGHTLELTDTNA